MKIENLLRKSIDLHVHIGPEIIPRKFTADKIAKEENGKLAGIVVKSHFYPTTPMTEGVKIKGIEMFGSIVLNYSVGGLNTNAIEAAAQISKKRIIVWFPTISSKNFLKKKEALPKEWARKNIVYTPESGIEVIKNGKLAKEAIDVIKTIKKYNCILATGHISWQEAYEVAKYALLQGVTVIITHPIYQPIDMPVKIQKELAQKGAFIEQCCSMYSIDKIPIETIANQIKNVGAKNCVLSSDTGQIFSKSPSTTLKYFIRILMQNGIEEKEIRMMLQNTRKIMYS